MDRKYYYLFFKNNKFRIGKDYIKSLQTDSIDIYFDIEFDNGTVRKNNEVFEQRRKARQLRDKLNRKYKVNKKENLKIEL